MQLLDAAIAFALTIAGFATVVSIIIEIIHRVLGLRTRGLRAMLEQHFEDFIWPAIKEQVEEKIKKTPGRVADEFEKLRANVVEKMTGNPLFKLQASSRLPKWVLKTLSQYNDVSAEEFLLRLPDTDAYKYIKTLGKQERSRALERFDEKYAEFEKAISNFFKRRAQLLSFIVGIILAVTANIHGIRIFERYLNDPELTATVIAQSQDIESTLQTAKDQKDQNPQTTQEHIEGIETALNRYKELMGNFSSLGIPIGWDFYPNCMHPDYKNKNVNYDPLCAAVIKENPPCISDNDCNYTIVSVLSTMQADIWGFLKWLFIITITGTLIGLGGPFWFDVARRLSAVRQKLGGGGNKTETSESPKPTDGHHRIIGKIVDREPPETPEK